MSGMNWNDLTPNDRLVAEQAVMNLRGLNDACHAAANCTMLDIVEQLAVKQGRDAIPRTLDIVLPAQDGE